MASQENINVKVEWRASLDLRAQETVQTGLKTPESRTLQSDLRELTPQQRQALVTAGVVRFDNSLRGASVARRVTGLPSSPASTGFVDEPVQFDREPTWDEVIAILVANAAMEAQQAERKRAHNEQIQLLTERRKAMQQEMIAEIDALEKAGDLESLRAYRRHIDEPDFRTSPLEAGNSREFEDVYRALDAAKQGVQKQRAETEKARWVAAHGSVHLKRACEAGYDCRRLYVVERAAVEAPGWIVDVNGTGRERERSCPSLAALDMEAEAQTLAAQIDADSPKIVWLTEEPTNQPPRRRDEWDDDEPFEACEAVMMRGYLNQYDLYRIV